jgi:hypothetical protein
MVLVYCFFQYQANTLFEEMCIIDCQNLLSSAFFITITNTNL